MFIYELLFGILLGLGAAVPIGPMNIEIMRRHLTIGARFAIAFGFGACSADMTYFLLLSLGLLVLFKVHWLMGLVTVVGSLLLLYFAYGAFRMSNTIHWQKPQLPVTGRLKQFFAGYSLTLVNPMTVIFWLSLSSQVASRAHQHHMLLWAGLGVLCGTVGWVLALNTALHLTRHKFSPRVVCWLNRSGAVLLLLFSLYGLYRVFIS